MVARGEEAQTLLDHPGMREAVITELAEVSAFLQRFAENFDTDAGLLDQAVWEDAPDVVTNANTALVMKLADRVTSALERLDNSATKHLLLIRSSPRYVDRVADQVRDGVFGLNFTSKHSNTRKIVEIYSDPL